MAEQREKLDKEEARFWVEQGLKVGLVVFAVYKVTKFLQNPFGLIETQNTDRIPFNFEETQVRKYYLHDDANGNPVYHVVDDPWHPDDMARRYHYNMTGWWGDTDVFQELNQKLVMLGQDRARWLHNYWLDEIDESDTLYRWIDDESALGLEVDTTATKKEDKRRALRAMERWGVGF